MVTRLPAEVELVLFRVLQEGLTNVHRHSGATVAQVAIRKEAGMMTLEVKDNGCGMSAETLSRFGILSLQKKWNSSSGLRIQILKPINRRRIHGTTH